MKFALKIFCFEILLSNDVLQFLKGTIPKKYLHSVTIISTVPKEWNYFFKKSSILKKLIPHTRTQEWGVHSIIRHLFLF